MHEGHRPARLLAVACLVAGALAQTQTPPDPSIFAPVQIAGDLSTGFPAYYVGCTANGATLQDIIVFSNANFLRGIEVPVPADLTISSFMGLEGWPGLPVLHRPLSPQKAA